MSGKGFLAPGNGREIENHIPVLREGNWNSQIATGREGKFEACNPDKPSAAKAFLISVKMIFATCLHSC